MLSLTISLPKPHDRTSLSIYLDVGDASFQIEPARWEKAGMANPAGVKVQVIFDRERPVTDLWEAGPGVAFVTDNGSGKFTKAQFLARLKTAKTLVILYTLREGVSKSAAFDLSESPKAISAIDAARGDSREYLPTYRISSDVITVGKAIFSLVPEVVDPKTHDGAVATGSGEGPYQRIDTGQRCRRGSARRFREPLHLRNVYVRRTTLVTIGSNWTRRSRYIHRIYCCCVPTPTVGKGSRRIGNRRCSGCRERRL
jgi:hypothetical protein